MVAYVIARGNAKAALAYYDHIGGDDYDTRVREPPGRWAGESAERLSLRGLVTQTEFSAALNGVDPKTGERLVRPGRTRQHSAGWDMILSAPKSVSVLWALSNEPERQAIEHAHRSAVMTATAHLERAWAWTRRGHGSRRERTAGLLMAQFDHHTSRASDPHLHTHCLIFNLAPRWDGSWGAIADRELYRAQKSADAVYAPALATGLERLGYPLDREQDGFRIAAIPRDIERSFSKRRLEIEKAARAYGHNTAKVMAIAKLRTSRPKREAGPDRLFTAWETEAKALGFELSQERQNAQLFVAATKRSHFGGTSGRFDPHPIPRHLSPQPRPRGKPQRALEVSSRKLSDRWTSHPPSLV